MAIGAVAQSIIRFGTQGENPAGKLRWIEGKDIRGKA
jgi:hypothetical protein